jgi:hypothetical protein
MAPLLIDNQLTTLIKALYIGILGLEADLIRLTSWMTVLKCVKNLLKLKNGCIL